MHKVWDHLVGPSRKTTFRPALRQTRMVLLVHGACGGMHEMTPTFGTMWAWPMWSPRQGVHKFGHKTHIASCGGSVVGFCRRKNPRKCIEFWKWTILVMHACHGHPRVCIQFGLNWWDREDKSAPSTWCMWRYACDCPNYIWFNNISSIKQKIKFIIWNEELK